MNRKRYRIVARLELIVTAEDIDTARQIAEDLQASSTGEGAECAWSFIEPLDEVDGSG
jgi:hypothetical protein